MNARFQPRRAATVTSNREKSRKRSGVGCSPWFGDDGMNRSSDGKSAELPLLGPLDNAEEVAIRVFEDNKIVLRLVSPGVTLRPESHEPFDFSISGGCVKVKVQPTPPLSTTISCLKRQIGSIPLWITKHNPTVRHRFSRHVLKCMLPKREHLVKFMAVDDDGADFHGRCGRHVTLRR